MKINSETQGALFRFFRRPIRAIRRNLLDLIDRVFSVSYRAAMDVVSAGIPAERAFT